MPSRTGGGTQDYEFGYVGDKTLRRNERENEKQNLDSRIRDLESRNKAVECKKTALVVSITVLFIATVTMHIYNSSTEY